MVAERRKPMREPAAAGAEIERANRSLPDTGERALLKVRVAFAPNAPFGGARIALRDHRQHPVVLGRRFAIAVLLANRPVLLRRTARRGPSATGSETARCRRAVRTAADTTHTETRRRCLEPGSRDIPDTRIAATTYSLTLEIQNSELRIQKQPRRSEF